MASLVTAPVNKQYRREGKRVKIKKWLISVTILTLALVMAGCGKASLTVVVPATPGEPGDISVDFQDDDGNTAGRLFVRTGNSNPDGFDPFFVEMPFIPDQD